MKPLFTLILLTTMLQADVKQELFKLYQDQQYKAACSKGLINFHNYRRDEEYVSLYAFSCLKADFIDRLAVPVSVLKYTEEARANAAYFSVILMQKKLLYHALIDGYDLSEVRLPTTDYVLSKVFDLYAQDQEGGKRDVYVYRDPTSPKLSYKLYLTQPGKVKKMVIEEYYDTIMTHRHIYW
jgi:hypothetical protein